MQQITNSIKDQDIFSQTINLSDLFRSDTFLNALRQQTARATKQPMDTLILNTSWSGDIKHGKNISIKITGLQLEGCSFEGGRLCESAPDSPSVTAIPACSIAWIPQVKFLIVIVFFLKETPRLFFLGCSSTRNT
jgi:dynein heavy chain 2